MFSVEKYHSSFVYENEDIFNQLFNLTFSGITMMKISLNKRDLGDILIVRDPEKQENIIAWAFLIEHPRNKKYIWLMFYVSEFFRNQGIGTMLLEYAKELGASQDKTISYDYRDSAAAKKLLYNQKGKIVDYWMVP